MSALLLGTARRTPGGDRPDDWRDHAACRNSNPDLWWPDKYSAGTVPQVTRAKLICARCPVAADCLRQAKSTPETDGIWGGLTPAERGADRGFQPSGYIPPLKSGRRLPAPAQVYPQHTCRACGRKLRLVRGGMPTHTTPDGTPCRHTSTGEEHQ